MNLKYGDFKYFPLARIRKVEFEFVKLSQIDVSVLTAFTRSANFFTLKYIATDKEVVVILRKTNHKLVNQ